MAALRAWADLDRFEVPDVPASTDGGWAAVGEIERNRPPTDWPPRPEKTPETGRSALVTRVMFGCLPVAELEEMLDAAFPDDQRFVQTGVRPARRRRTPAGGLEPMTCRGSFLLDAAGQPVPDSLSYSPLIDFARHVRAQLQLVPDREQAVAEALRIIDTREAEIRQKWNAVVDGPEGRDPAKLVLELLATVSVRLDVFRYVTVWVAPDQEPMGQLPAFFRDDLLAAADAPTSALVAAYLAGRPTGRPSGGRDVADRAELAGLVRPAQLPRATWPSKYRPRLSQQVALNALLEADTEPLMSVNGPPGTGKTTLLRDLYANLVTDRAEVMVRYDDPVSAFAAHREVPSGAQRTWALYAPAAPLCGFEMLVASSNNAAVENVSQELPVLSQVAEALRDRMSYFRAATQPEEPDPARPGPAPGARLGGAPAGANGRPRAPRPGLLPEGAPAWGFAAAVLGSRNRVGAFAETVGRYRKGPGGTDLLALLAAGATPAQWAAARRRFAEARAAVGQRLAALEEVAADLDAVDALVEAVRTAGQAAEDAERRLALRRAATERAHGVVDGAESAAAETQGRLQAVLRRRPSVWARVFRTRRWAAWEDEEAEARTAADRCARTLAAHRQTLAVRLAEERTAQAAARSIAEDNRHASEQLRRLEARIEACPQRLDAEWWERSREQRETSSGWVDEDLHGKQAELFAAAMHVHELFARRAGRQMSANLRLWMALQTNEVEVTAAKEVTLAAWQALFLLIPLASTTFASMARLLQNVPTGALGWLIVDEAGQAVPAAAVGGLARCRRAVVVGDPQQLEPVVTLPAALVAELMRHHRAPADLAPNRASVQTLTDAVSRTGTDRLGRWIGLPLVVHNRCLDPMFSVANEVAYGGEMILGRVDPGEDHPWGPSRWIDVPRPEGAHFYGADADHVMALLQELDWSLPHDDAPGRSVAIISPFKEVVRALDRRVRAEVPKLLSPELRRDEREVQKALEAVSVGTVHTFQGREKVAVVLVLGGGSPGARSWAAGTPNLFNVAVTRAKDRLVVVGDRSRWGRVGHMRTLDAYLPT